MEQQTKEWLEFRKQRIGASEAPIIMGVGFKTPFQLWQEKLSLAPPQFKSSAMQRGLDLEPEARLLFTIETGIQIEPKVLVSKEFDWMMASLDGLSSDNKTACEIKCPGQNDHEKAIEGQVPEKYIPQLQHQMKVLELDQIFYASYSPGHQHEFVLFIHKRDDKYIKDLIDKETYFFECMLDKTPPEFKERDFEERSDREWLDKASQWQEANRALKALESKEKLLRGSLIEMTQNKNTQGGGIKIAKHFRKGAVDYSSIQELALVDLEKYRKPLMEYWKIV